MDSAAGRASMADYMCGDLIPAIDEVARHRESAGHMPLSERLASMGVLPMFGFPYPGPVSLPRTAFAGPRMAA